jgi:hypothetical protein
MGMKNVTITLDEQTVEWAKLAAARQNKSLSRFVGDVLQGQLKEAQDYQQAMHAWFNRRATFRSDPVMKLPAREELYDERTRIR